LFAGQLAARRGDGPRAVDYADRTLGDNRVRPYEILSSASLIMSVTSPESTAYANAWKRIEDLARDPDNPASLDALVFVAEQQPPTIPASEEKDPLRQMVAPRTIARMPALEVAERLEKHPAAGPPHQVLALKVRARELPSLAAEFLKEAVTRFRDGNDETLIALSNWLSAEKKYETVLEILPLDRAIKRRELFVQRLDALSALGRFEEVRDLVLRELSPLDRLFRQIYLAIAREKLGETAGAANEWQNALDLADNANKSLALGNYAERSGPPEIADAAYARALSFAPNLRAAYDARLRMAETRGETAKALEILGDVVRLWPEDEHARGHENYLRLLLGAGGAEAEKAVRDAEILVAKEPRNWQARATLALGRLRLNQPVAALEAFSGIRAVESSPPGPLAVRAVALDANGWKDGARGDARTLAAANLLPEATTGGMGSVPSHYSPRPVPEISGTTQRSSLHDGPPCPIVDLPSSIFFLFPIFSFLLSTFHFP
jgi:tetratricopeptide (TPR) repeat protein